jgi:anaerobic magnesium-protoporphyrin IX monomethyl ester cyclase
MVWVSDDVFTINHAWLRTYAAELKQRGIRIPFECISRADRLSPEMMDLLAELGCFRMWIGSESGSQRILDAMDRGVKIEQVHKAVEMCRERGIQSGMFLMWGYEGEDIEDIEATIKHVTTSKPDIFFTTVSYPIKGTPYYNRIASRLIQISPWGKTSDRELEIRGRHSRTFYTHADKVLRDEVALARMLDSTQGTDQVIDQGQAALLRQAIANERAALLATYAEVEG